MKNTYTRKEFPFSKYGAFFAFSDKQFDEQKKKGVKYESLGAGLICPTKNVKNLMQDFEKFNIVENLKEKAFYSEQKAIEEKAEGWTATKCEAPSQTYEERKEAKIERYQARAIKADKESVQRHNQARKIGDMIPFGQPILVGHHSEAASRRAYEKINLNMRKGIEAGEKADYYRKKAESTENNTAIYSDDPEAISKLKAKIEKLEEQRNKMKAINADYRKCKGNVDKMTTVENKDALKASIAKLESWQSDKPFQTYRLTNLGSKIRTAKKRLERLEANAGKKSRERTEKGVRIVENRELNRLQLFFPGIPSTETRKELKSSGFRWSRLNNAWQAFINNRALYKVKDIMSNYEPGLVAA